jgi:hypothetical protein
MLTLSHELPQNQLSCGYCSIFGMPLIYKHFTWTGKHRPPNSNCITYVLRLLPGSIQERTSATMQKRYVTCGEIITIWQLPLEGGSAGSGHEWLDFDHRIRVLPEPIVFCRAKVNKLSNNLPLHEASTVTAIVNHRFKLERSKSLKEGAFNTQYAKQDSAEFIRDNSKLHSHSRSHWSQNSTDISWKVSWLPLNWLCPQMAQRQLGQYQSSSGTTYNIKQMISVHPRDAKHYHHKHYSSITVISSMSEASNWWMQESCWRFICFSEKPAGWQGFYSLKVAKKREPWRNCRHGDNKGK